MHILTIFIFYYLKRLQTLNIFIFYHLKRLQTLTFFFIFYYLKRMQILTIFFIFSSPEPKAHKVIVLYSKPPSSVRDEQEYLHGQLANLDQILQVRSIG